MGKQNEYRFNLKFDETDEDHRRVSEFLNGCGRKKARYVVKAMLAYWALQEGKNPVVDKPKEEKRCKDEDVQTDRDTEMVTNRTKARLIQVSGDRNEEMDQEEAELMLQNYAMFDDME